MAKKPGADEDACSRWVWEAVVKRVRTTPSNKLVAMVLATYSDGKTGANAHPGLTRLINTTGLSKRTVLRALEWLRTTGLVERTFEGSSAGRAGRADVYRLAIPDDLMETVELLTVEEQVPPRHPVPAVDNPSPHAGGNAIRIAEQGDVVAPVQPDSTGTGATDDTEQVPLTTEQVPLTTGTGATSLPPPVQTPVHLHHARETSTAAPLRRVGHLPTVPHQDAEDDQELDLTSPPPSMSKPSTDRRAGQGEPTCEHGNRAGYLGTGRTGLLACGECRRAQQRAGATS